MVLAVMAALMIGVLKLAEGSTDSLRLGVQDFLSELTRQNAEVTEMPKSELFPEIIFHIRGVIVRDRKDNEKSVMKVDDAYLAIDFWRSFIGFSKFNALEIRNLELASGYFLPEKLNLVFAGISDPPPHVISPQLLFEGTYNQQDLMATIEMRRHGTKKPKYDFGKVVPMTFKLGTLEASGYLERKLGSVGFEKITAVKGPHQAVFSLKNIENNPLSVKADGMIDGVPFKADLSEIDNVKTLRIVTADPEKISKVVYLVLSDFGIDKDDKTFMIEVLPETADSREFVKE